MIPMPSEAADLSDWLCEVIQLGNEKEILQAVARLLVSAHKDSIVCPLVQKALRSPSVNTQFDSLCSAPFLGMHVACRCEEERSDSIAMLLKAGADLDVRSFLGSPAFHYLLASRHADATVLPLIQQFLSRCPALRDAADNSGRTSLHCAVRYPARLACLVKAKANGSAADTWGNTPLHDSVQHDSALRVLLRYSRAELRIANSWGICALQYACGFGRWGTGVHFKAAAALFRHVPTRPPRSRTFTPTTSASSLVVTSSVRRTSPATVPQQRLRPRRGARGEWRRLRRTYVDWHACLGNNNTRVRVPLPTLTL